LISINFEAPAFVQAFVFKIIACSTKFSVRVVQRFHLARKPLAPAQKEGFAIDKSIPHNKVYL